MSATCPPPSPPLSHQDASAKAEGALQTLRHQLTSAELNVERLTKELAKRPELKEFMVRVLPGLRVLGL